MKHLTPEIINPEGVFSHVWPMHQVMQDQAIDTPWFPVVHAKNRASVVKVSHLENSELYSFVECPEPTPEQPQPWYREFEILMEHDEPSRLGSFTLSVLRGLGTIPAPNPSQSFEAWIGFQCTTGLHVPNAQEVEDFSNILAAYYKVGVHK